MMSDEHTFDSPALRRERIDRQVRQWCDRARIDGRHAPLSDAAALCLAAGHLDEETREILAVRRRTGRPLHTRSM